jgi:hypothetical protein
VVDLIARLHTTDAAGSLVMGHLTGATWSGWSPVPGSPAVIDDPAVTLASPSALDVVAEGTNGALALGTSSGSTWTWSAPFGTTSVAARPALLAVGNGTLAVIADLDGTLEATTRSPGAATWSGFAALPGTPTVASAPSAASPDAQPYPSPGGSLDVFAESSTGTVVGAQRSTAGQWTYFGSGPVPADATRTTAPRTLTRS